MRYMIIYLMHGTLMLKIAALINVHHIGQGHSFIQWEQKRKKKHKQK